MQSSSDHLPSVSNSSARAIAAAVVGRPRACTKDWSLEGLDGGAIYTDGKVSFYEDAQFTDNEADVRAWEGSHTH